MPGPFSTVETPVLDIWLTFENTAGVSDGGTQH